MTLKVLAILTTLLFSSVTPTFFEQVTDPQSQSAPESIYGFKVQSLNGDTINLSDYRGQYMLLVNTASKCGYTEQYKGLEALYRKYRERLVVIGFPSDNFMQQEFDSDKEILSFCQQNYGVSFPLSTRVDVKGKDITPVFDYLTRKARNGVRDAAVT